MAKAKRKPEQKKMWIIAVMAFLLVATIVGIYSNYQVRVGKAIFIGETPWTAGTIDLTAEETVTFRVLPDEDGRGITIKTGTSPYDAAPAEYTFFLAQLDETTYQYALDSISPALGIARDVLSMGTARDSSFIYIDREDAVPELEVFSQNNQITVKNLHYIRPGMARIALVDGSNVSYPSIIRLEVEEEFTATIWANSSSPPTLRVNVGTLTDVQANTETNSTAATFTYTAPAESQAVVLDITATVQGKETHAYYTFAVGDVVYALQETGFPNMTLTLLDEATATTNFTVTFARTRELQPFALPCEIGGSTSVTTLFGGTVVERVYTYDTASSNPRDWNQGDVPNDFTAFEPFKGYFVQLRTLAEGDSTTISGECALQDLLPVTGVPSLGGMETHTLPAGWNLVSLPGTIPRALAEFTTTENVRLFSCTQNYICGEISATTPLTPGKPYWVFTEAQLQLRYTLE